jgi:hypothetical protein
MAWAYCRRPSCLRLALWIGALASLYVINRNLWALAALPLIFAASQVRSMCHAAGSAQSTIA